MALTTDGDLWAFGAGQYGELGNGETKNSSVPRKVELPTKRETNDMLAQLIQEEDNDLDLFQYERPRIKTMACGAKHSMVLTVDGSLYSFGFGQHGQLGHRNNKNVNKPRLVADFTQ